MDLQNTYWPQSICLFTQVSLTMITTIRLIDNRQDFPVRQLGPESTILCSLCFLLANIFSLIGRILSQYYPEALHCKIFASNQLFILALLYNIVRELPFVLFVVKCLRVSLCFWPRFNKVNVEDIPKCFVGFLKNQTYFVGASLAYVLLINLINVAAFGIQPQYGALTYEFFCPKLPTVLDFVVSLLRLLSLGFVLYLSLWAYQELDFKKFLFFIFLISNLFIVPHMILTLLKHTSTSPLPTRTPIYYTSYLISLFHSCLLLYYSGINKELTQPAMQGVLQSWQAFHNLKLGMDVLFDYAEWKDQHAEVKKYSFRCLESFDYLDQLLKEIKRNPAFLVKEELVGVGKILQRNQFVRGKLGQTVTMEFRKKCANGTMEVQNIQKIQKILSYYCENQIFNQWKSTKSYKALREEFINNGEINEKLALFGIPVV